MTKIRLQFVQAFVDRKTGKVFHYFRRRGMPRVALKGLPGSTEFMAAYAQALAATPTPVGASTRSKPGSISAAIAEYYSSHAFRSLKGGTPAKRRALLEGFRSEHGHRQLATVPREFLIALLDTMAPFQARNWLTAFRHFAAWAVERKLLKANPTLGIKLKTPKSDGFATWTEDEIAAYEAKHPIGSKARLALALGLYTAQRRGDVVRIGRQHIRDGILTIRQAKTGATLAIPVHPELARIIAATTIGHLTLLTTRTGKSYEANGFNNQFRVWCDAAGLPMHCKFHGLRKAACTRLADAGCTPHEIAAISGHQTLQEVARYTRAADQVRLARAAMERRAAAERIANESVKREPGEVSKPLDQLPKKAG
jgi:integrase